MVGYSVVMEPLNSQEVLDVLSASGISKRKRKLGENSTPDYQNRMKREAEKILGDWINNGITSKAHDNLKAIHSVLLEKYEFNQHGVPIMHNTFQQNIACETENFMDADEVHTVLLQ